MEEIKPSNGRVIANFYGCYQAAYDHFNDRLFHGILPGCMITLRSSGGPRVIATFRAGGFVDLAGQVIDEIKINPQRIAIDPPQVTWSIFVHEMVHQWQHHYGKVSESFHRYDYTHNSQWSRKMRSIGLQPSDTGRPGGKQLGKNMTHYILAGGEFERACEEFIKQGNSLPCYPREYSGRHVPTGKLSSYMRDRDNDIKLSKAPCELIPENASDGERSLWLSYE